MKNYKFRLLALLLAVTTFSGCGFLTEILTPKADKGSVDQKELNPNPKSVVGYVGDVMPFYEDGVMNIFYLQDGRNTNLGFHPYALMTTSDYVNYKDYGEVIPFENSTSSPDFALGTGSVIKDKDGLYHCFYTGYNGYKYSGLPYFEKIQHATSTDKIHWTKHPEDGFYGGNNDFRDPYVYYSEADSAYYMLITTRDGIRGVIKQYKSTDLKTWTDNGIFFANDSGTYNMECPTFLEYNGYYYLSYSEQGDHRVTHYRYKKNFDDPWIKPEVDFFDGEGFYAARMEKTDKDLLIFGWCGTKQGFDNMDFEWGGNLVAHKLVQQPNGELRVQMIDSVDEAFNTEVSYTQSNGTALNNLTFKKDEYKASMVEKLSNNVTKLEFTLNTKSLTSDCGLSFGTYGPDVLSKLVIAFDFKNDQIAFYNEAKDFGDYNKAQIAVPYKFEANKDIQVQAIINNDMITIYVDSICLTTRMYDMVGNNFSFYTNGAAVSFNNIKFYE